MAMARMGNSAEALRLYALSGLADSAKTDHLALRARLLKDLARTLHGAAQRKALRQASDEYARIYRSTGASYAGINAASLAFAAGDEDEARHLAEQVLTAAEVDVPACYFDMATRGEALLLLGQEEEAATAFEAALRFDDADAGSRSSTVRQLAMLAGTGHLAGTERPIENLRAPPMIHYCGHIFGADEALESRLARDFAQKLDRHGASIAFGSLAAGSDIVFAETLLERGGELHVVLPFRAADFVAQSVAPGGPSWVQRFEACLAKAASATFASEACFVEDDEQFAYGSMLAMGMARLRARHLETEAIQIAAWDSRPPGGAAGTAADVERWKRMGGRSEIISLVRPAPARPNPIPSVPTRRFARTTRGIVFTDYAGFSRLDEAALPLFWEKILGAAAAVLDRHEGAVRSRNTWGDAIFAIVASACDAARIAVDLQEALAGVTRADPGLLANGGMRVAVHYGPVFEGADPVTRSGSAFGTEVTRAARIEPVTPTGAVYGTLPFAAMLANEAPDEFDLLYVGRVKLAKGYGELPMYKLTRRTVAAAAEPAVPMGAQAHG
jgi:adenylate cyclase